MAKLSGYRIPRLNVKLGDENAVTVRGLSMNDLMMTFEAHSLDMETVYNDLMQQAVPGDDAGNTRRAATQAETMLSIIKKSPSLVAALIACAADEPDEMETVLAMPFSDQIALGEAIIELTLKDTLILKKLREMASKAAEMQALPQTGQS